MKKLFSLLFALLAMTAANAQILKGDMNGDGQITMVDANEVTNTYLGKKAVEYISGANGYTPDIGSNGNWWIGATDTGVKAQGPAGTNGKDGYTPYIGSNGNWWINGLDTGYNAQGPAGTNGKDGYTPCIGSNGNWWINGLDTGYNAQGPAGTNGYTPYIGSNGNWWIDATDTGVKAESGDPFHVDNSYITGKWFKTKTETITFNADGTTDYNGGCNYKFQPYQGRILFLDKVGNRVSYLTVWDITKDSLFLGNSTIETYTRVQPVTNITIP